MKHKAWFFGIVVAILVVLSLPPPPLAAQDDDLQPGLAIATGTSVIRAEASRRSDNVMSLQPGDLVMVLEIDGEWAYIEIDDVAGWVQYLSRRDQFLVNAHGPSPAPRGYHQMAYDVESDRMILFGGIGLNDTWSYEVSTNTWTRMSPAQSPPVSEGPMTYDAQSDRVLLFANPLEGTRPTGRPPTLWAYDVNTDTWTNLDRVPPAPPSLAGARMVYDIESDRTILFGGLSVGSGSFKNDTWAYDFDTNTWTQMDPEVRPPGMNFFPMAYDAAADRVIVIGSQARQITDDTWAYDYNTDTWEMHETPDGPGHRDYSAMVYSPALGQVILFGQGHPRVTNDTWAYDYVSNTWTELEPETRPRPRGWHAMAYSTAAEQLVLFGGGTSRERVNLETWVYDPIANTWMQVGP